MVIVPAGIFVSALADQDVCYREAVVDKYCMARLAIEPIMGPGLKLFCILSCKSHG